MFSAAMNAVTIYSSSFGLCRSGTLSRTAFALPRLAKSFVSAQLLDLNNKVFSFGFRLSS